MRIPPLSWRRKASRGVIALYAAELAGRGIVMLPEEDVDHNVRLAHLLGVKVAILAADEFDPELVRRLRAEAGVERILHMNEHDHSGSEGNLFEGETRTMSLPDDHPAIWKGNGAGAPMIVEQAPWAFSRKDIIDCLTTSAHTDLDMELSKIAGRPAKSARRRAGSSEGRRGSGTARSDPDGATQD